MQRLSTQDNFARLLQHYHQRTDTMPRIQLPPPHLLNAESVIDALYGIILQTRRIQMDEACGIASTCIPFGNANVWIREVGIEMGQVNTNALNNNYARLFYTYLIAAVRLAMLYKLDCTEFLESIRGIYQAVDQSLPTNKTEWLTLLATQKQNLVEMWCENGRRILGKQSFSELLRDETHSNKSCHDMIERILDQTKDWIALEKPTLPVVTLMRMGDAFNHRRVAIIEEPCTRLTNKQKQRLRHVTDQAWYKELLPLQQRLVRHYTPFLLAENRVIPSQLRAYLPLQKNAWRQSIAVQESETEWLELNSYYHCGTVSHLSHQEMDVALKMTKANLLQQKENSQTDAMIMICLNSALSDWVVGPYEKLRGRSYTADDSQIVKLTQQASERLQSNKIYYSKICLNGFRQFEFNAYGGVNAILAILQENLRNSKNGSAALKTKINEIIVRIHSLESQYIDQDVKGLDILYYLSRAAQLNNELVTTQRKRGRTISIWFGCASGENRTGIAYLNNLYQTMVDYYEFKYQEALSPAACAQLYQRLAQSQHAFIMTGNQGGTFGTEGIRLKSIDACKKNTPKMQFVTTYADLKNLPLHYTAQDDVTSEKEIARNTWLYAISGIVMGLAGAALATVAIMLTLSSFGVATPLSAVGLSVGAGLLVKSAGISATTVGVGTLISGMGLGFFSLARPQEAVTCVTAVKVAV